MKFPPHTDYSDENMKAIDWSEVRIYDVAFQNEHFAISLNVHYLYAFEPQVDGRTRVWGSPGRLTFENVSNLRLDIDQKDRIGLYAQSVSSVAKRRSPTGALIKSYTLNCDIGVIALEATGFKLSLHAPAEILHDEEYWPKGQPRIPSSSP